ncbi:alpha/beta hydrolase family protein [Thermoactinomyces mirandus]|uniref:Alpha/beta fold hydrolase n=1 Tax=Thermoactinomyces mirandus TaxID=2756294 RepID=A0A7W1XTJ7_9BACL|nr:alpha/beta fold hydrolase [Thermoactinomyces mirandus]MBA4603033.1 alpha/beta fold hydrolase [Thermoactinomyces mirandus]
MRKKCFSFELGKENRIIRGDIHLSGSDRPAPVILICHGFKGFKNWGFFPVLAEKLAEAGFIAISFNFSMNGVGDDLQNFTELEKFSRNTFSREQEDISFLVEKIKQGNLPFAEAMDHERIGIMGHSRGGGNSLIYALDHPENINAVTIWNSIHRVDFFAPELISEIEKKGVGYITNARTGQLLPISREVLEDIKQNDKRFAILNRVSDLQSPLFIVQGGEDIPGLMEGAKKINDRAPKSLLHIIPSANHTMKAVHPLKEMTPELEEAIQETAAFFKKHL